jgi:hypothetical protein
MRGCVVRPQIRGYSCQPAICQDFALGFPGYRLCPETKVIIRTPGLRSRVTISPPDDMPHATIRLPLVQLQGMPSTQLASDLRNSRCALFDLMGEDFCWRRYALLSAWQASLHAFTHLVLPRVVLR